MDTLTTALAIVRNSCSRVALMLALTLTMLQPAISQPGDSDQEPTEKPKSFWQAYMDGWDQLRNVQPESAFTSFERALELKPNHTLTMVQLTRVLLKQENFEEADSMSQMALASDSSSAPAHFVRGRVFQSTDRNQEAIEAYRKSIELREHNPYAYNNLGLIYIVENNFEEAASLLQTAVEQKSDVVYFHNNLGIAYEGIGDLEKSKQAFETALELDPDYSKAIASLNRVKGLMGEEVVIESETEVPVTEVELSSHEKGSIDERGPKVEPSQDKTDAGFDWQQTERASSEKRNQTFVGLQTSEVDDDQDGTAAALKFAGVIVLTIILAIAFFIRNNRRSEVL